MHTSILQYNTQSILNPTSVTHSEINNNQQLAIIPKNSKQIQISPLLPQNVISSLFNKDQILEKYQLFINSKKSALERDMDNFLKEIIFMFEDLKQQLFLKTDDQMLAFRKIFDQFERIAVECSDWAEQKIGSSQFQNDMKSSVTDLLYQGIHQARYQKQKADEIEKSLLAIKQKIDSSKLNELNEEIKTLSDERNHSIYVPIEAQAFYEDLKNGLKKKISQLNQSKIIPPFAVSPSASNSASIQQVQQPFYDQQVRESIHFPSPNKPVESKTNLSGFLQKVVGKEGDKNFFTQQVEQPVKNNTNVKVNSSNYSIQEVPTKRSGNEPIRCGIIAQQNQFYSDEISLSNPTVKQEKEIPFKIKPKINAVLSLLNNVVLFGAEDGCIVIMNLSNNFQSLVKAHTAPVKGLTKANESLVLSSALKPDTSIKLWDFGPILSAPNTTDLSKPSGNVLLVGVLKGLNEGAIGHGFIAENLVLALDMSGQILIWDWKTGATLTQSKIEHVNPTAFVLFSDRDSFAVGTSDGYVIAYSIIRDGNNFSFFVQSEVKEVFPIVNLHFFRGNNDIIITALSNGEIKLISIKAKLNYHTIAGCKSPLGFFVLNSVKNESNIYLMCLEPYGFKLADVDGRDFSFLNTQSVANFRFESRGWPNWQIVDSVSKEKITFVTINNGSEPNCAILWSLNASI